MLHIIISHIIYRENLIPFLNIFFKTYVILYCDRLINRYAGSASKLQYNGERIKTFVRRYESC